jgi:uncharacterized membrane protein (UPF0182 family)
VKKRVPRPGSGSFSLPKRNDLQSVNRFARRLLVILLAAIVLLAIVGSLSETLSERWWANEVGFAGSFDYRLKTTVALWAVALTLSSGALWLTVRRVERVARGVIAEHRRIDASIKWPLIVAGTLTVAPILGGRWMAVMLARHGWSKPMPGPPLLGPDPGFYVFRLPLLQALTSWFTAVSAVSVVMTVAVLVLTGLVSRRDGRMQGANPGVARLIAVPVVCLCFGMAAAMWWSRFGLASRRNGRFVGFFAVDYSMRVPALSLLALGALAIGASTLMSVRRRSGAVGVIRAMSAIDLWDEFVLLRIGVVLWLTTALTTIAVIPGIVSAQPLSASGQQDNIARHVEATLIAYDLENVVVPPVATSAAGRKPAPVGILRQQAGALQRWGLVPAVLPGATDDVTNDWIIGARSPVRGSVDVNEYATTRGAPVEGDPVRGLSMRSRWHRLVLAVRFGSRSLVSSDNADDVFLHHTDVRDRAQAIAPFLLFDEEPYIVVDQRQRSLWVLDAYTGTHRFPGAQRVSPSAAGLGRNADLGRGINFVRPSVKVIADVRTGEIRFYRTEANDPIGDVWANAFPGMFRLGKDIDTDYPGVGAQLRYPHDLFRLQASVLASYHSRDNQKLVTGSDQWAPVDLSASESIGRASVYQPYLLSAEVAGELSAIRVLEQSGSQTVTITDVQRSAVSTGQTETPQTSNGVPAAANGAERATAILVGRSSREGRARLTIDRVSGPAAGQTKQLVAGSASVDTARIAARLEKTLLEFGPLQPLTVGSGLVFVQTVYVQSSTQSSSTQSSARAGGMQRRVLGVVATEGNRVVVAQTAEAAVGELLDAMSQPVTTVSPATSLRELERALVNSEKRLTESERVISSLQERIAKLESSVAPGSSAPASTVPISTSPAPTAPTSTVLASP